MRILVTVASKHGATAEIGQAVADVLARSNHDVEAVPVEDAGPVDQYDAVVLGSAVYAGHWLRPAAEFVQANAGSLALRPVWLFSSGPIGNPPKPTEEPVDVAGLVSATAAREHRVFSGRLDRSRLGWAEKAIVLALRAPEGDFRDWADIRAWAATISDSLHALAASR